jgi:hypothetical protein
MPANLTIVYSELHTELIVNFSLFCYSFYHANFFIGLFDTSYCFLIIQLVCFCFFSGKAVMILFIHTVLLLRNF